jgi:hypothetical protein
METRTALRKEQGPGRLVADRACDERLRSLRGTGHGTKEEDEGGSEVSGERWVVYLGMQKSEKIATRTEKRQAHDISTQNDLRACSVERFCFPSLQLVFGIR